jgi:hypothetical protein
MKAVCFVSRDRQCYEHRKSETFPLQEKTVVRESPKYSIQRLIAIVWTRTFRLLRNSGPGPCRPLRAHTCVNGKLYLCQLKQKLLIYTVCLILSRSYFPNSGTIWFSLKVYDSSSFVTEILLRILPPVWSVFRTVAIHYTGRFVVACTFVFVILLATFRIQRLPFLRLCYALSTRGVNFHSSLKPCVAALSCVIVRYLPIVVQLSTGR